jgi:2,3-dihydroxybenzoate decarboxylase
MKVRKIALEEHFTAPVLAPYQEIIDRQVGPAARRALSRRLEDFDQQRLAALDEAGIDLVVLSQTTPGVQAEPDPAVAVPRARATNDYLHAHIARHPDRYRGFAHLPMQDVKAAGDELERCVRELRFVGALINGDTNGVYLDDERYLPFWERVVRLGVPVYLHPGEARVQPHVLEGYTVLQRAVWGWSVDTSSHFLRLLFSGLFDRFPELTIILGHMGETIPYYAWRVDSRSAFFLYPARPGLEKKPSEYLRTNLVITTTGVCQDSALQCAIAELGEDRVMFSVDYPFEDTKESAEWIERTRLTDAQREKICHKNAERILRLDVPAQA